MCLGGVVLSDPYNDPVIIKWHKDGQGNKISLQIINEEHVIVKRQITLMQIPDPFNSVEINDMIELKGIDKNKEIESANQFKVDYSTGLVTFHSDLEAANITVDKYYGRGIIYYPSSRIYTKAQDGNVVETLGDILESQVRNFIFSKDNPPINASDYPEGSIWFVYQDEWWNVSRWMISE